MLDVIVVDFALRRHQFTQVPPGLPPASLSNSQEECISGRGGIILASAERANIRFACPSLRAQEGLGQGHCTKNFHPQ